MCVGADAGVRRWKEPNLRGLQTWKYKMRLLACHWEHILRSLASFVESNFEVQNQLICMAINHRACVHRRYDINPLSGVSVAIVSPGPMQFTEFKVIEI